MIKKIGSNKYGVVEYAISSVEDIADLPLGVAIGSTAVLIDKDGIRTFALGEGEWVEYIDAERYDKNKLAQDLLFCEFGNDGEKHDDLDDRLMVEFDEINERVNVGNYLEYNGCHVKADYSLEGLQRGVMLEGRTLQNLIQEFKILYGQVTIENNKLVYPSNLNGANHVVDICFLCKPNTTYSIIFEGENIDSNNSLTYGIIDLDSGQPIIRNDISSNNRQVLIFNSTHSNFIFRIHGNNGATNSNRTIKNIMILEGDHTQTPLEELPFIEGIESVGESELTDDGYKISGKSVGKNLLKINNYSVTFNEDVQNVGGLSESVIEKFIKIKPNTQYTISYDNLKIPPSVDRFKMLTTSEIIDNAPGHNHLYLNSIREIHSDVMTFTTESNENYITLTTGNWVPNSLENGYIFSVENVMLEESSTTTPYEPYQESTYEYILDEPLRSLPDGVCDTIDLATGVLTRRVGKAVLDGSYTYYVTATGTNTIKIQTASKHKEDFKCRPSSRAFCDTFPYMYGSDDIEHFRPDGGTPFANFTFWINKTRLSSPDIDGFKEWIRANPTTVYYKLKEPTIHQLDQNRIYSFKNTTHITSDNLIAPRITTNILTNSNALISHLKGENLALANEVSTLSLRNREMQETNETQDHIIDASLCAVDELYMMYETTQEVEAMSTDEEGSRMVDMYVAMVQRGLKTIDQVPVRYRERVREILAQLED